MVSEPASPSFPSPKAQTGNLIQVTGIHAIPSFPGPLSASTCYLHINRLVHRYFRPSLPILLCLPSDKVSWNCVPGEGHTGASLSQDTVLCVLMKTPQVGLSNRKQQVLAGESLEFQRDLAVLILGKGHLIFLWIAKNHNNAPSCLDFFQLGWT